MRYLKEFREVTRALDARFEGGEPVEFEGTDAVDQLTRLVKRYKKYERTDPDRPPATGSYWSPRQGFLRVAQNVRVYSSYGQSRVMKLGLEIGSKFALPKDETDSVAAVKAQQSVIEKLKREAREVLDVLAKAYGGYVVDQYGTAYSQIGWVEK